MRQTISCKPYLYVGPPKEKNQRVLNRGIIGSYDILELETYWEDPNYKSDSVYLDKLENHWTPVPIAAIEFEGVNDSGNIKYKILGEDIDNPKYEEQLKEYNRLKDIYDKNMKIWEQEEAQEKEERILAEKKKEIEIYMKLKKIYEGQENDLK